MLVGHDDHDDEQVFQLRRCFSPPCLCLPSPTLAQEMSSLQGNKDCDDDDGDDNDDDDDDDLDDDNDDDDDYDYHNLNSCPDLSMLKKCCCKIDHNYKNDNERTMPIKIILGRKCLFPLSIYTQLK